MLKNGNRAARVELALMFGGDNEANRSAAQEPWKAPRAEKTN